jgi:hypothetical protein
MNKRDISRLVDSALSTYPDLNSEVKRHFVSYIVAKAQGVFVWVRLAIVGLTKYYDTGSNKQVIYRFLESLPAELEDFYHQLLYKLEKKEERQDLADGLRMFQFALFAYRPLKLVELGQALAIPNDPNMDFIASNESFNDGLSLAIDRRIVFCGGNFLEIIGDHGTLFPSPCVRFSSFTNMLYMYVQRTKPFRLCIILFASFSYDLAVQWRTPNSA